MKKKDVKIDLILSKTISNDSDKLLSNGDFVENDKLTLLTLKLKSQITGLLQEVLLLME